MKILALELSSARGSLAVASDGRLAFSRDWPNDRQNSGPFFANLRTAQAEFGQPDVIVVGLGPGSYAGTRIAISAAIGLAASGARLIGYPSICAIACETHEYCVIGDARRETFFFARVVGNNLVEGPDLFSESDLDGKLGKLHPAVPIFVSEQLPRFKNATLGYPAATALAALVSDPKRRFAQPPLEPMYLRLPHITVPKVI